jgi:signal transduction histidine kinase
MLSRVNLYVPKGKNRFIVTLLVFMICCLPVYGQESDAQRQLHLEQIIASQRAEKLVRESEMLRMKLEMEKIKVRNQLLIIVFVSILCLVLSGFSVSLYLSRKQIRKKNMLLNEQNQAMNAHKEEITLQSEQLAMKNEFLLQQNNQLAVINQEKNRLVAIVAKDLSAPLNQSKSLTELLKATELRSDQLAIVNRIAEVNEAGLILIKDMIQANEN